LAVGENTGERGPAGGSGNGAAGNIAWKIRTNYFNLLDNYEYIW